MRTTRIERRGLERERRTGMRRRREFDGAAEAEVVSVSEAFCGRNSVGDCWASSRAFWRLRCGRSCVDGSGGGVIRSDAVEDLGGASFPLIELEAADAVVKAPLLPAPTFPSKEFGEK